MKSITEKDKNEMKNLALIALAALLLLTIIILASRPAQPVKYEPYTVCFGDTLWNIAQLSDGHGRYSTDKIVRDIITGSNSVLRPGDLVFVPMYGG